MVLTSQFNTQGERTSLAATISGTADFINSYGYDNLSRLNQIAQQGQSGGNAVAAKSIYIGYDNAGDITQLDFSDSTSPGPQQNGPGYATLTYSSTTDQLTGIDDESNGTSLDDLTYGYDGLGRVSTFGSIDGTATYGYDNTSQLVSATYTTATGGHQPANISFSWDANGNNNAPGNVVSKGNEVTNDGTFTYAFDPNGNRTSRTRISNAYASDYRVTYSWDYRNRLTDVEYYDNNSVLTKHVHYVYNVYNDLIEEDIDPTGGGSYTTVEQFVLDVQPTLPVQVLSLAGEIDPSAPPDTLLEFVEGHLAYRDLSGPSPSGENQIYAEGAVTSLAIEDAVDWVFANNQGSPTDVVDADGNLIDHRVYSPFGQIVYVSAAGVYLYEGFDGGRYDPYSGIVNFLNRWYDPLATIWMSADPSGFQIDEPNLSRYVRNSPIDRFDPSGLEAQFPGSGPVVEPLPPVGPWRPRVIGVAPRAHIIGIRPLDDCVLGSAPSNPDNQPAPGKQPEPIPDPRIGGEPRPKPKPSPKGGEGPEVGIEIKTSPDNSVEGHCEVISGLGPGWFFRRRRLGIGIDIGDKWTKPWPPDTTLPGGIIKY